MIPIPILLQSKVGPGEAGGEEQVVQEEVEAGEVVSIGEEG